MTTEPYTLLLVPLATVHNGPVQVWAHVWLTTLMFLWWH